MILKFILALFVVLFVISISPAYAQHHSGSLAPPIDLDGLKVAVSTTLFPEDFSYGDAKTTNLSIRFFDTETNVNIPSVTYRVQIFQENNLIVRAMRDHLDDDIGEIIIDDETTYKDARKYIKQVTPKYLRKLKSYKDSTPLFTKFQIENQIESAYANEVILPSGGTVVIDFTEALVSIDINSGKATKLADIEATALQTNIEAAEEIARQCRLRDMGGLLVIDFIDMRQYKNQKTVVNTLKSAVKQDRAIHKRLKEFQIQYVQVSYENSSHLSMTMTILAMQRSGYVCFVF